MNAKKFKHDIDELKSALESSLNTVDDEKYLSRIHCVLDVLNGRSTIDIANELNCNVRTIQMWVNTLDNNFDSEGCESLRPRKSTGRKSKFSENQINEINDIILTTLPFQYGLQSVYWTGDRLAEALSDVFPDLHITPRNCREFLRNVNYQKEYVYPINVLSSALTYIGIDAAKELLALFISGESEETIREEYRRLLCQTTQTRNTLITSEPDMPVDDDEDDYDDEDDW